MLILYYIECFVSYTLLIVLFPRISLPFHQLLLRGENVLALSIHQKYHFLLLLIYFSSHCLAHHRNAQWQTFQF